jgi:hypothetical protein
MTLDGLKLVQFYDGNRTQSCATSGGRNRGIDAR